MATYSASRLLKVASNSARRGTTTMSRPGGAGFSRKSSRISRLARFRSTAESKLPGGRDAEPASRCPASRARRWSSSGRGACGRCRRRSGSRGAAGCARRPGIAGPSRPALWDAPTRSERCRTGPTVRTRPTGACGPWRGAASGRSGRSWSACGRGIHGSGGAGGCSAETCAYPVLIGEGPGPTGSTSERRTPAVQVEPQMVAEPDSHCRFRRGFRGVSRSAIRGAGMNPAVGGSSQSFPHLWKKLWKTSGLQGRSHPRMGRITGI